MFAKMDELAMEIMEIGERLAELRLYKGVSAREMSLSIGQSENYINKIENGRSLPSITALFDICYYLNISLKDFFDRSNNNPSMVKEYITDYMRLNDTSQAQIAAIVKDLARDK